MCAWTKGNQKPLKKESVNEQILNLEGYLEDNQAKIWLYKFLKENVTFSTQLLTGIELFPFQHMAVKAMMENDYFLGVWCKFPEEYVLTTEGYKKIKDIKIGDYVQSRHSTNKVLNKWTNKKEEGLEVSFKNGLSFKAKKGHRILTYNKDLLDYEFKKIEDLVEGDFFPIKCESGHWGKNNILKQYPFKEIRKIVNCDFPKENLKISNDLFYALGYFIGDGYFNKESGCFSVVTNSQEIKEKLYKFFRSYRDKDPYSRKTRGCEEITLTSKNFTYWLSSIGFDDKNKAQNKIIPDSLFSCKKSQIANLIRGIFDADGYCCDTKTKKRSNPLGLKSTSYELLKQVHILLLNFGIYSSINNAGGNAFDLKIQKKDSFFNFAKEIGFTSKHKKENLNYFLKNNVFANHNYYNIPGLEKKLNKSHNTNRFKKVSLGNKDKLNRLCLDQEQENFIKNFEKEKFIFTEFKESKNIFEESVDITVENEENYVGNGFIHHNSRGMSKCNCGETIVHTENGRKKLKNTFVGESILTKNGYHKIIDKWEEAPFSGYSLQVETKDRSFSIRCRADHKIFINKTECKFVQDLKEKDFIYIYEDFEKWNSEEPVDLDKKNYVKAQIKCIKNGFFETVGITVEKEHNYIGNGFINHNSFSTGIFALLDAMMNQGVHIGIISKSFRQCITPDALVSTKRGLIKARDLNVGDMVFSEKGHNKILNKWTNKPASILKLQTNRGYEVKGKKNHKILCLDEASQTKIYKDLSEIKKGDYVAIQIKDAFFPKGKKTHQDGYFYGTVIGDGCVSKNKYGYVCITTNDLETVDSMNDFAQANDLNLLKKQKNKSSTFELRINNKKWINDFFQDLDDSKKAYEKFLPESVLNENREFVVGLLSGLFDTDGCVSKDRVELASSSLKLIKQVQILLLKFGIISKIQKEKARGSIKICGYNAFGRESYKLRITSLEMIKRFYNEIGFKLSRKQKILNSAVQSEDRGNCNIVPCSGLYLLSKYRFPETLAKNLGKKRLLSILNKYSEKISLEDSERLNELTSLYWDKVDCISPYQDKKTIDIEVENEHCYTGNGFVNHNSKMIFRKIEDIAQDKKAELFRQCIGKINKSNDEWSMQIGSSRITALPLGDGEKLRGFRFQRIIIDELLLMPEKVLNEVIMPFLAVVENPTERQKVKDIEDKMIAAGKMKEEDRTEWPSNKMIGLSSASYKFEYLYKMYQAYENMIFNPGAKNQGRRCIMQFSYDCAPKALYDENLISQAIGTMSQSQIDREFNAQFTDDSAGYFKISKMAECTIEDGQSPAIEVAGEEGSEYIMAFDPSWSESETSDDFAIQIIKLLPEEKKGVLVHSYALPGTNLKKHIIYFKYILDHFNIIMIVGDYNGGVQFINSCNESEIFKKEDIEVGIFEAELNNPHEYTKDLKEARRNYNLSNNVICHLRKPLSTWIRTSNEMLQTAFDRKRIYFAATAMDDNYSIQKAKKIPIESLKFSKFSEEKNKGAKMIDFIEHQKDMIDLTKAECALIQVSTSTGGTQSFDLPSNLKRQKGTDRPRKDSYSALVLGNWGMNIYYDMMDIPEESNQGFTPMFI